MLKSDVELGGSLFVHHKSKVHLLTKTATTVLCKSADHLANAASASDEMLPPCRLWLPRTRAFRFSLQIHFADDVVLTPIVSHNVDSIIEHLIEGAELWAQLGYHVSQIQCHKPGGSEAEPALKVDFEVQSQPDFDSQPWSPIRVDSWELELVKLHLRFTGGCRSNEDQVELPAVSKQRHEHVESQVNSFQQGEAASSQNIDVSFQQKKTASSQRSDRALTKQGRPRQPVLNEDVFCALFDAGFRSSICSKPIRLATGIKFLTDDDARRLCDLAPATFVPNYVQRLQEYAQYIPGISRQLLNFINLARSITPRSSDEDLPRLGHGSHEIDRKASQDLQKHLWNTVTNGIEKNGSARRLRPLKHSGTTTAPDTMLEFPNVLQQSWQNNSEAGQELDCNSEPASYGGARSEDDLLDFCLNLDDQADISLTKTIPMVATEGISCTLGIAQEDSHDVEVESDGERMNVVLYDCLFEQEQSAAPPQHESRKYSNSFSQMSDVSMLLAIEAPMKDGRLTGQAQAIGGSSWLTQNVIRMHPLRQQQQENDGVDRQDSAGIRYGLYERPDRSWWSDTSDASEVPLEDYHQRTKSQLDDVCLSPSFSSKEGRATDIEETLDEFGREGFLSGRTTPMSTRQIQDNSNNSLAEVIGNDHLLWHMWKRRASVAPRGEEDVTDMKTLFATDPDMKLFSSKWDLDPSDLSSSSNEDPMLQETGYDQSPRNQATSPMTPNSERRSYFTPPRSPSSSSSSGYVGRSSADPSRRSSLIKRFTWGGRRPASQGQASLDLSKLEQRTMEVKRRKTLDDYESMDREASNDDSSDMLF